MRPDLEDILTMLATKKKNQKRSMRKKNQTGNLTKKLSINL